MKTASAKAKAVTCENCLKRGVCVIKGEIGLILAKFAITFSYLEIHHEKVAWMEFLGNRCREYVNDKEEAETTKDH